MLRSAEAGKGPAWRAQGKNFTRLWNTEMADQLEHLAAELAAMLGRLDALLARSAALSAEQRTVLDEVDELVAAVNSAVETLPAVAAN
jgi:hypothetical protein